MAKPNPPTPPTATFHSPEELLATAKELMLANNPKIYRGAILEALAALESFVHRTVFPALAARYSTDFSKWLEDKTKMDFDSRLSVLAPIATGVPVDKGSTLWLAYKQTRELRKGVVHSSRRVTVSDVDAVIENTRDWMAYLGSTIELESALLELKRWVESHPTLTIQTPAEAEQIVAQFFTRSKAANATLNKVFVVDGIHYEADAILEFGARRVLVETKFVRHKNNASNRLEEAVHQVDRLRRVSKIPQACVVLFAAWAKGNVPSNVEKHAGGDIFSVVIRPKVDPV
jgi:hypothetical protein